MIPSRGDRDANAKGKKGAGKCQREEILNHDDRTRLANRKVCIASGRLLVLSLERQSQRVPHFCH